MRSSFVHRPLFYPHEGDPSFGGEVCGLDALSRLLRILRCDGTNLTTASDMKQSIARERFVKMVGKPRRGFPFITVCSCVPQPIPKQGLWRSAIGMSIL